MSDLTPLHINILQLAADGRTTAETATELNYSMQWIREMRMDIFRILDAKTITHAVAIAWRRGLIS